MWEKVWIYVVGYQLSTSATARPCAGGCGGKCVLPDILMCLNQRKLSDVMTETDTLCKRSGVAG